MNGILLKNITIDGQVCDLQTNGKLISAIEPAGTIVPTEGDEVVDCTGKVAIPGFINMHTHSAMSMMRGISEDVEFQEWIAKIWDIEAGIDHEYIYWGSMVAGLEMIRTGTTTFNDQYWSFPSTMKAARELGIRAATGYDVMDKGDTETAARQKDQCLERYEMYKPHDDSAVMTMSFHAIYSVSEEMMLWANEFAQSHDLSLHIHLSETLKEVEDCKAAHGGLTPVQYLDRLGMLNPRLIAAHTLWLSPEDIELLGQRGVNCIHNINSNTKLCSGYKFPYHELKDAGANVCIGTDGCASSNNLDMLEAMKTSALFQKAWRNDPKAMPITDLMQMATANGAKALRLNAGALEPGRIADINIVDTDSTFFLSPAPFLSNLIYSAHSDCIESVIAAGKFVMRDRVIDGEKEILREARKAMSQLK